MRKIAIVDDEPALRDVLSRMVQALGYTESSGYQISAFSEPQSYLDDETYWDLTLLDFTMTGMNGLDVLERKRAAGHNSRVCMVSGNLGAYPDKAKRARELGADFIQKPFDLETLGAYLKDVLGPPQEPVQ